MSCAAHRGSEALPPTWLWGDAKSGSATRATRTRIPRSSATSTDYPSTSRKCLFRLPRVKRNPRRRSRAALRRAGSRFGRGSRPRRRSYTRAWIPPSTWQRPSTLYPLRDKRMRSASVKARSGSRTTRTTSFGESIRGMGRSRPAFGSGQAQSPSVSPGGAVWVVNQNDSSVSKIDPRTNSVIKAISVGAAPSSIAAGAGADGSRTQATERSLVSTWRRTSSRAPFRWAIVLKASP